jgi:uncharacterized protein (DUF58 family)
MIRMRVRQPAFLILAAFLMGLELMDPSRVWMILMITTSGMVFAAFLWTWSLGSNLKLLRENNLGWVQVGGQIEERITLTNASPLPAPWIQLIDQSTLPDFNASRSTSLDSENLDQWIVSTTCKQRGLFYLGGSKILTGDPFGIFDVTIHSTKRSSILVLPQVTTLPQLTISPSGLLGEGQPRRNAPQQTLHASTVREYAHGDSIRLIHWPTTARTNKTFVRLMESAPEGNWWILLDLDQKTLYGRNWDSIEEQSVALAASLADLGLRSRKSVGLISNGGELGWLPPKKGEGQKWEIMQALALAVPGNLSLSSLLEKTNPTLGKHSSLIIITASQHMEWLERMPYLIGRGIIPTVILFDASTFGGNISARGFASALAERGIQCQMISRGLIAPPKMDATPSSKWTWRTTRTGEVLAIRN